MDTTPDRTVSSNKRNSTHAENEERKKIRPNVNFKSICDQNEPFDLSEYFEYLQRSSPNNNEAFLPSFTKSPFLSSSQPSLHHVLQETFSDYEAFLDSNSKARLTPLADSPTAYEGREGARRIEYRLRKIGFTQFTTRLNDKGEITVSDGSFEKGLLEWEKAHVYSSGIKEAIEKIKAAYYSNATELNLSSLNLRSLPKEIGKLSNLKLLYLGNNHLSSFPKELLDLSNLEILDASGNGLTELPSDIDKLSKLTHLVLTGNRLTHLPPTIGSLSKLVKLYVNGNYLTELPREMKNLSQLRDLNIGGHSLLRNNSFKRLPTWIQELTLLEKFSANQVGLETFPIEVCSLPHLIDLDLSQNSILNLPLELGNVSSLKYLCLNVNRIKNLPSQLSNLSQLRKLEVGDNQIRNIPVEFGDLQNLEEFDVEDNRYLSSLPLSLGNCMNLTQIQTSNTRISEDERDAILDTCRALRDGDVLTALPLRLAAWETASGKEFQLDFIHELEERQRQDISEWLLRLERTDDFNSCYKKDLVEAACGILQSLNEIPSFKEDFFAQVPVNNTDCEDRAGMAFNEIYLAWRLATLPDNASEKEKLKLMTQAAKTLVFRKALGSLMAGRTDMAEGVQIYLYYEVKLKEAFDLLTAMKSMSYEYLGKRDWIENSLGTLKEKVETQFLNEMLDFAPLEKMLKNDSDFAAIWSQSEEEFNARLEKIENGMLDENALLTQMNQVAKDLKASYKELIKTTTEGKLRHHGFL